MGTENAQMKVIKWERIWNDNREKKKYEERERERERERIFATTISWVAMESKIVAILKPKKA